VGDEMARRHPGRMETQTLQDTSHGVLTDSQVVPVSGILPLLGSLMGNSEVVEDTYE